MSFVGSPRSVFYYLDENKSFWARQSCLDEPVATPDGFIPPAPACGYSGLLDLVVSIRNKSTVKCTSSPRRVEPVAGTRVDRDDGVSVPFMPPDLIETPYMTRFHQEIKPLIAVQFAGLTDVKKKFGKQPILTESGTLKKVISKMIDALKTYVEKNKKASVATLMNYIDLDRILHPPECAMSVLFMMVNPPKKGGYDCAAERRMWNVLMSLTTKYTFVNGWKERLLMFFEGIVCDNKTLPEIRLIAKVCGHRVSSLSPILDGWLTDEKPKFMDFFDRCISSTALKGFSLGEMIDKEKYRGECHGEIFVPVIIRQVVQQIVRMNGINSQGIFRVPGERAKIDAVVDVVDNGGALCSDEEMCTCFSAASTLLKYLRELPLFIIPDRILRTIEADWPRYKCIALINSLPNEHVDTLMCVVGLMQDIVDNVEVTRMTPTNLSISIGGALCGNDFMGASGSTDPVILRNFIHTATRKREYLIKVLINGWDTSPVWGKVKGATKSC